MLEILVLCFSMLEEDIFKQTNAKCHVFTLRVNLLTLLYPKHRYRKIIEHTNLSNMTPEWGSKILKLSRMIMTFSVTCIIM